MLLATDKSTVAVAQAAPNLAPLELRLLRPLDSGTLHVGDEVLGKLRSSWSDGTCSLPGAAVIHGTVTQIANGKQSELTLQFRYGCSEGRMEALTWLALLAPNDAEDDLAARRPVFASQSFRSNGIGSDGNSQANHVDLSGRQSPTFPLFPDAGEPAAENRPTSIQTGEVWKLPRLSLRVGTEAAGGTKLSSARGAVKLPIRSVLVLLPEAAALLHAADRTGAPQKPSPVAARSKATLPLPPALAACVQPACSLADAAWHPNTTPEAVRAISLRGTGYRRLHAAEMQGLEYGAAVTFLGKDHLLFTFNPHGLVPRAKEDRAEDRPHMVRAVMLNVASGKVERTFEWRIHDDRQYLWPNGANGVVVHNGSSLQWIGADGVVMRSLPLRGGLAYFRISPDQRHYAVGVIHEVHSPADHLQLLQTDADGPEEQVELTLRDANLNQVDNATASSRMLPPMLVNEGRVELRHASNGDWYLRKEGWAAGAPEDFARFRSTCRPEVSVVPNDLLLVKGCDAVHAGHWYTIFLPGATPVLKGSLTWHEFAPLTAGVRREWSVCAGRAVNGPRGKPGEHLPWIGVAARKGGGVFQGRSSRVCAAYAGGIAFRSACSPCTRRRNACSGGWGRCPAGAVIAGAWDDRGAALERSDGS